MNWLEPIADVASIITATVAAVAYGSYLFTRFKRRKAIEGLIQRRAESTHNSDFYTLEQLAAALTLTEDQVIDAVGRSKKVESFESVGAAYRFRLVQD